MGDDKKQGTRLPGSGGPTEIRGSESPDSTPPAFDWRERKEASGRSFAALSSCTRLPDPTPLIDRSNKRTNEQTGSNARIISQLRYDRYERSLIHSAIFYFFPPAARPVHHAPSKSPATLFLVFFVIAPFYFWPRFHISAAIWGPR